MIFFSNEEITYPNSNTTINSNINSDVVVNPPKGFFSISNEDGSSQSFETNGKQVYSIPLNGFNNNQILVQDLNSEASKLIDRKGKIIK